MLDKDHIKLLLKRHFRHLQKLEEQKASFGLHTPPHILIEIEDEQKEIEELKAKLEAIEDKVVATDNDSQSDSSLEYSKHLTTDDTDYLDSERYEKLNIVKPGIDFTFYLPLAFGESSAKVEINTTNYHDLTIHLSHQDILGELLIGLSSPIDRPARPYLKPIKEDAFKVSLGQNSIILSKTETKDLCACIDEVGNKYKKSILDAEDALETWYYEPMQIEHVSGVCLLRIRQELWELMHRFSREFDYDKGKTAWHIFEAQNISIRVCNGINDHAFLWPKPVIDSWGFLPTGYVFVLYQIYDSHLKWESEGADWKKAVGERGIWSAHKTKLWLKNKFIPKVIDYYQEQAWKNENVQECSNNSLNWLTRFLKQKSVRPYWKQHLIALSQDVTDRQLKRVPFSQITEPKQLAVYVNDVQSWFLISRWNLSKTLILPYYIAFTNLVQQTSPSTINYEYVGKKLGVVERRLDKEFKENEAPLDTYLKKDFDQVLNMLRQHITRVEYKGFDEPRNADNISRVFGSIVENGEINFSQVQLNEAKIALKNLWREGRFSERYPLTNFGTL